MIRDDDEIKSYFPDEFFTKKTPERKFFFDVINTVYDNFLPPLITHASQLRIDGEVNAQKDQVILATDEWVNELQAVPFFSKVRMTTIIITLFYLEKWQDDPSSEKQQQANCWYQKEDQVYCQGNPRAV